MRSFPPAALIAVLALVASPADAQMMLPGALQAAPEASGKVVPPGAAAPAKPKPVIEKPPGEEAVTGRELMRDGAQGRILIERGAPGGPLAIAALSIEGEQIGENGAILRGEVCRIDVVSGAPIEAVPAGRSQGLLRYDVAIAACSFSFDVLDGAILVSHEGGACEFRAADCRVDPNGLWGPAAASIDDKQIKQLEKARGRAETAMRMNFRALAASAGKDKEAVKRIAAEQAGFSSQREMTCRSYAREETHGFCALKLTQGRSFSLRAAFEQSEKSHPAKAGAKKGERAQARPAPNPGE